MNLGGTAHSSHVLARRLAIAVGAFALVLGVLPMLAVARADDLTASQNTMRTGAGRDHQA